jgi:hypothetical protein
MIIVNYYNTCRIVIILSGAKNMCSITTTHTYTYTRTYTYIHIHTHTHTHTYTHTHGIHILAVSIHAPLNLFGIVLFLLRRSFDRYLYTYTYIPYTHSCMQISLYTRKSRREIIKISGGKKNKKNYNVVRDGDERYVHHHVHSSNRIGPCHYFIKTS